MYNYVKNLITIFTLYNYFSLYFIFFFFFNDTATTEIYTLSLHDALPIYPWRSQNSIASRSSPRRHPAAKGSKDRKSTRLNSSHANISYAVFCLKKKKKKINKITATTQEIKNIIICELQKRTYKVEQYV